MKIAVCLRADEGDARDEPEDMPLKGQTPIGQVPGRATSHEIPTVVGATGNNRGRSPNVLTRQRSTPQLALTAATAGSEHIWGIDPSRGGVDSDRVNRGPRRGHLAANSLDRSCDRSSCCSDCCPGAGASGARHIAGQCRFLRDAHSVGVAWRHLHDHGQLQVRPLSSGWSVSEGSLGGSCLLDLEGWHSNNPGSLDDRRHLRTCRLAAHILRRLLAVPTGSPCRLIRNAVYLELEREAGMCQRTTSTPTTMAVADGVRT